MDIYGIAEKAGVSIATVSRVLNDDIHVSEATRRKVLRAMEQTGYVPNAFARSLGRGAMKAVGLLCPDANDPYQASALAHLESAFRSRGYGCSLICTGSTALDRTEGLRAMRLLKVDALVLMGSAFSDLDARGTRLLETIARERPVLMLNAQSEVPETYSIRCDDRGATREAVLRLAARGCRRILYLYHSGSRSGREKLAGYREALEQSGITPDERLVRMAGEDGDMDQILLALERLRDEGVLFDAVMTSRDQLAVAAVKHCLRHGLRVPEDVCVIGYDDLALCRCCEP